LRSPRTLLWIPLWLAAACGDRKPPAPLSAAQVQVTIEAMDRLLDARQYEGALRVARELASKAPQDPLASEALARALLSQCNAAPTPSLRSETADAYARAAAQRPTSPGLQSAAGVAAFAAGRLQEAIVFHQKARQLEPGNPQHLYMEAMMWNAAGMPGTATDLLQMALKLQPDSPELEMGLAEALGQDGDIEQALRHLRRSRSLSPNDASIRARAAAVLRGARQPGEAADLLLGSVSVGSADRATSELCAKCLAEAGRHAECAQVWEKIAAASQMSPEPLIEAARAWNRAGDRETALSLLEKARQAGAPRAYHDLAMEEIRAGAASKP
jgi:Flp pilus assembly protein TadD